MPSMKPGALHVVAALAAALVCGSSLAGLLAAQSAKVESEDGVVTVTLLVETTTGSQATLRARDGRKVTISEANGEAVALTPTLRGDQLEVRITDLSVAGTELELTPVMLVRGVPATLSGMPAVSKVTWVSLTVSHGSSPQRALPGRGRGRARDLPWADSPGLARGVWFSWERIPVPSREPVRREGTTCTVAQLDTPAGRGRGGRRYPCRGRFASKCSRSSRRRDQPLDVRTCT
jgi:hypothetical protein